ncbi:MAG: protein phosphatase 2C domain-containing protein [Polyangiaceae bacterium]
MRQLSTLEIGSRLLVQGVVHRAAHRLIHGASSESLVHDLLDHGARLLDSIAHHLLASRTDQREELIRQYLLTTLLLIVDDGLHTAIVAQGDGLIVIDDQVVELDHDNTPPYLAYRLLGQRVAPTFVTVRASRELSRIALASDGLDASLVPQLWGHQGRSLQRWLNVRALREPLHDDTTVIVLERTNTTSTRNESAS